MAAITGMLKKRIATDITIGIGGVFASYWWWGFHKNVVNTREKFYAELAKQKQVIDEV